MTAPEVEGAGVRDGLAALARSGALDLPAPGSGNTPARWRALYDLARTGDVSLARLAEAHLDAVGILAEAGLQPIRDAIYGVWASVGRGGRDVEFDEGADTVSGTKPFCSGVGIVDRALVEVRRGDARVLVEVDVSDHLGDPPARWATGALADTATGPITLDRRPVVRTLGPPGWYLSRPGFWHGAVGPAACWAGGAAGLIPRLPDESTENESIIVGAMHARRWSMEAALEQAGRSADERPDDARPARFVALSARHHIHEASTSILDDFARTFGPRPFVSSAATSQRWSDTHLYLRQFSAAGALPLVARSAGQSDDG